MKKTTHIPIHSLEDRGKSSFEIARIDDDEVGDLVYKGLGVEHRDDYYIFFYQQSGHTTITVDFEDITISGNSIYCIQPGQVHFGEIAPGMDAWTIAVAAEWMPPAFRIFLMETAAANRPVPINTETERQLLKDALQLLLNFEKQGSDISAQLLKSMFDVCLHLFMQAFQQAAAGNVKSNLRPELITRQFKSLLLSNFRMMKSPAEYAAALNITPAYLNEVVKDTTGYAVSHWIQQEIILEAKRTLFYTNNTVKEIAYDLGYSDPSYFIRLFKKITGISPLLFRRQYRK